MLGFNLSVGRNRQSFGDADAQAFITATGLTGTTETTAVRRLVSNLKTYGLWSKMKAIYPFISDQKNLLNYTEDLTNIAWSKQQTSVLGDQTTAPDGTNTADKVVENTATDTHRVYQGGVTVDITQTYTYSFYVKPAGRTAVMIRGIAGTDKYAYINISNGTLISGNITPTITSAGNGWYRCSISFQPTSTSMTCYMFLSILDNPTYTGDGTSGVYLWGEQLEISPSVTSYQKTVAMASSVYVQQFKYNLKDPRDLDAAFRLAFNGTWAYSKQGATGNGTNAYANSYFIPDSNGLTLNNNHISFYSRTSAANGAIQYYDIGSSNTTGSDLYSLYARRSTDTAAYDIGNFLNNRNSYSNTDGSGYFVGKINSDLTSKIYQSNVLKNTKTVTNQATLSSFKVYIGGLNENDSVTYYSPKQVAFATMGNGLSDTEASNLYTSVQLFNQDLNRAVGTPIVRVSDADAQAFVTSTQIQNTLQAEAVNTLVTGLKSANLWSKMKAIYPFVSDTYNLLSYSQDFSNAYWQKNTTLTANATTAPDGTNTATQTSGAGNIYTLGPTLSAQQYSLSIYAKANTATSFELNLVTAGFALGFKCAFNLSNGTAGTVTNYGGLSGTASISNVGNGWYRCTISGVVTAAQYYVQLTTNANAFYIWGAQLEQNSSASVYTPVLTTPANRFVSQFKYNLISPLDADSSYRLAFNGSWTYSLNGALPNGTNAYADTKLIPNSHLSIESNHMSFYSRTQANTYAIEMGCEAVTTKDLILYHGFLARKTIVDGAFGTNEASSNITNTLGYQIGSRTSLSNLKLYWNNSLLATNTATKTDGQNSISIIIGATNKTTIGGYSSKQAAFSTIGDGLNDSEASTLYTLVQNFQTTLGRQV